MSWQLLPGDLIVLIGQYLDIRDILAWTHVCKRLQTYLPTLLKELGGRNYYGNDRKLLRKHTSDILKSRHLPLIRQHFNHMPLWVNTNNVPWWVPDLFREHLDLIVTSPSLREYFLQSEHSLSRYYRCRLVDANMFRVTSDNELPVYFELINWRELLYSLYRRKYWKEGYLLPRYPWYPRNMSMMNYLFLQTYTDPEVDPVIARVIRQHYRPTQRQLYKAVRMYLKGNVDWLNYRMDWETLIRLLLRQFPLSELSRQRVRSLYHNAIHNAIHNHYPQTHGCYVDPSVFPFDL